jgi:hypothetical protein
MPLGCLTRLSPTKSSSTKLESGTVGCLTRLSPIKPSSSSGVGDHNNIGTGVEQEYVALDSEVYIGSAT